MVEARAALLGAMRVGGGFGLSRRLARRGVRILCYHGIWRGQDGFSGDSMFMLAETFRARLALLKRWEWTVISLDDAVRGLAGDAPLPEDPVVITMDDAWYSSFADMLPALKALDMPATIYCDTGNLAAGLPVPHVMARYIRAIHRPGPLLADAERLYAAATDLATGREERLSAALAFAEAIGVDPGPYLKNRVFDPMTQAELAAAAQDGFAVELHTHNHSLHGFEPVAVADEIAQNRGVLAKVLGRRPETFRHFCYPSGETAPGVGATLSHLGIASATTLRPGIAFPGYDPMMLPRLLDGEHMSELAFEAELCGIGDQWRRVRASSRQVVKQKLAG
jgi:peptidoglycan/xylan/chitin deacetylase (PgdA/CDA1 family)